MHRGIIRLTCPKAETTFSSNTKFKAIEHIINTAMSNSNDYDDNMDKIQYNREKKENQIRMITSTKSPNS